MSTFHWSDKYAVQVSTFDRQHQMLFQTVNELHEALGKGQGKMVVGDVLKRLINYTATHFAAEESAMERTRFPGRPTRRSTRRWSNRC